MMFASGVICVVFIFLFTSGFAGSPQAAASTIDHLNKRAERRAERDRTREYK